MLSLCIVKNIEALFSEKKLVEKARELSPEVNPESPKAFGKNNTANREKFLTELIISKVEKR